ncbi:MAG: hypothetical protein JKY65_17050, partial [Planctomycetes bacterium]|nr:hypothetical protein [Planctomycetota bacterium]
APRRRRRREPKRHGHCAFCQESLQARYATCPTCRISYHRACAHAAEGCLNEGCAAHEQGYVFQDVDKRVPQIDPEVLAIAARDRSFNRLLFWLRIAFAALVCALNYYDVSAGVGALIGLPLVVGALYLVFTHPATDDPI